MLHLAMRFLCRILTVLLLLAFGLGTPGYAMASGDMAGPAMMSASDGDMTGADREMPAGCDDCIDDVAMTACVSVCLGVQAMVPDAGMSLGRVPDVFNRLPQQPISGMTAAPDPFPPKLFA